MSVPTPLQLVRSGPRIRIKQELPFATQIFRRGKLPEIDAIAPREDCIVRNYGTARFFARRAADLSMPTTT